VRGAAFSAAFSCAYAWAFATNHPLFLYYPLHGELRWGTQAAHGSASGGPAMAWYGIVATASLIGALVAVCMPRRLVLTMAPYLWLFPLGAMVLCAFCVGRFV